MKKVLALPLFAMAALVSQAWGECIVGTNGTTKCCYWSASNCWGIGGEYDEQHTPADCEAASGLVVNSCSEGGSINCDFGVCENGNGWNCTNGGCFAKPGLTTCPEYSTKVDQCECSHMPPEGQKQAGARCGNANPIISYNSATVTGLNVVHFANSLQIASGKDATVSLFDISGKQMFSQKVFSGTTTISLENQKLGVYYAVVKSGSQKETVKVILK